MGDQENFKLVNESEKNFDHHHNVMLMNAVKSIQYILSRSTL